MCHDIQQAIRVRFRLAVSRPGHGLPFRPLEEETFARHTRLHGDAEAAEEEVSVVRFVLVTFWAAHFHQPACAAGVLDPAVLFGVSDCLVVGEGHCGGDVAVIVGCGGTFERVLQMQKSFAVEVGSL